MNKQQTTNNKQQITNNKLKSTSCAICDTSGNETELYPANFDLTALNPEIFSARRLPDRIHYRIVKCNTCGLVRSDPVAPPEVLAKLYAQSTFEYGEEVTNLKFTYGKYLAKLTDFGAKKNALLEIGCGNGFFLEEALRQGYTTVRGVEPSLDALVKANPQLRPTIICDILRPGLFQSEEFDVICLFQVLDHIPNPGLLLDECLRILKPEGLILCINHNVEAVSARLLKNSSPIIDIEHTYLYSPATMKMIFSDRHFQIKDISSVFNIYTLYYLTRLLPLPAGIKNFFLTLLKSNAIGRIPLSLPLGNLYLIAQKPNSHSVNPLEANI